MNRRMIQPCVALLMILVSVSCDSLGSQNPTAVNTAGASVAGSPDMSPTVDTPPLTATKTPTATHTPTETSTPTHTPTSTPTPTATPIVVRVIEAENCENEPGCKLEGAWRPWDLPGFRNGRLIHNEGLASDAKLILTFEGAGVIVVYRQDTWYGTLLVDMDGSAESLDQQGPVRNQAEARFEAGSDGRHTLVLTGSKESGVINIDAIEVLAWATPTAAPTDTSITTPTDGPKAAPTVVSVIEAEDCNGEPNCQLESGWKPWDRPEFSNGRLMHNEGLGTDVRLALTFEGTGIVIVYRRDTWYGTLEVEIDGHAETLNQRGPVQNQAEARFEADSSGLHTLILTGSAKTGVITIDAIKIIGGTGSSGQGSYSRGIVVPAYFYPDLPYGYWSYLASVARDIGEQLIVVANPSSGPGTAQDPSYSSVIELVAGNGGRVLGYVWTCYGNQSETEPNHPFCPKTEADLKSEIDSWYAFYPGISGIFFDGVSSTQGKTAFYQLLYDYVQKKKTQSAIVLNFGVSPHQDYSDVGSSILGVFENESSEFATWTLDDSLPGDRSLALVHNAPYKDLQTVLEHLKKERIGYFYVTSDKMPNPWDKLPGYFPDLVDAVFEARID